MKYIFLFIFITWSKIDFAQEQQKADDLLKIDYTWDSKYVYDISNRENLVPVDINEALYFLENFEKEPQREALSYLIFDSLCLNERNKNLIDKKLLAIYQNKLSYSDIKRKWVQFKNDHAVKINQDYIDKIIIHTKRQSYSPYWQLYNNIYDSLIKPDKLNFEKNILTNKVPKFLILLAGWLKLPDCIKYLEDSVNIDKKERFDFECVKLALAKYGNDSLKSIFENRAKYFFVNNKTVDFAKYSKVSRDLIFIASQESIFSLNYLIDTTIKENIASAGGYEIFVSSALFPRLFELIKNEDFKNLFNHIEKPINPDNLSGVDFLKIKEWIIKNKGKYELDKKYVY